MKHKIPRVAARFPAFWLILTVYLLEFGVPGPGQCHLILRQLSMWVPAVLGMMLSMYVRPRRLWLRATETADGLRVEAGGLDRAESSVGLADDVAELAASAGLADAALTQEVAP